MCHLLSFTRTRHWGCLGCALFLGLAACHSGQSDAAPPLRTQSSTPKRALRKVTGSFVDFTTTSYVSIRCTAYERTFGQQNPFLLDDSARLQAIAQRLAVLQPDTMSQETDVRAQAVLFYSDHTQDTLCMDKFTSLYRGQRVKADTLLYQLLGVYPPE
jgi:hypothetical protein